MTKLISIRLLSFFILASGFFMPKNALSTVNYQLNKQQVSIEIHDGHPISGKLKKLVARLHANQNTNKFTASVLTITLGVFGVHRLYLGTETKIPVLYTATLGGGLGIVPLVDLIFILASKDLERFENDNRFFMWGKSEKDS